MNCLLNPVTCQLSIKNSMHETLVSSYFRYSFSPLFFKKAQTMTLVCATKKYLYFQILLPSIQLQVPYPTNN